MVKKATNSDATFTEEVVREFPPMGKYRIRLVKNPKRKDSKPALDIREYITGSEFEGFTRRGIRITLRAEAAMLQDVLKELMETQGPNSLGG